MDPQKTTLPAQVSDLPAGVVNAKAWQEIQQYKQHPLYSSEARIVHTSIEGLTIDIMMSTYALKMKIRPLPEKEQQQILAKHTLANTIKGKIGSLSVIAFGGNHGAGYAEAVPILDPRKAELIELFGKMYTAKEVHEIVTTQWGYQLSITVLEAFKARHRSDIEARQEEVKRDAGHIRLGYKPVRMEELSYLHSKRKRLYDENPSIANERQLQSILEQIRKEAEGEISTVHHTGEITVNTILDPLMRKQLLQGLSVTDIIIGRVAARLGRNPQFLMQRLQTSMYAKFTGMATQAPEDMEATPIYPSLYIYDFDKIRSRESERKAEELALAKLPEVIMEAVPVSEAGTGATDVTPPRPKVGSLRERMLANLKDMREQVGASAEKVSEIPKKDIK
jgi:hypothetical protein